MSQQQQEFQAVREDAVKVIAVRHDWVKYSPLESEDTF
jgi:hypothetical protein